MWLLLLAWSSFRKKEMSHKMTAYWWGTRRAWEFRVARYLDSVHSSAITVLVNGGPCPRISGRSFFLGPLEVRWWKTSSDAADVDKP